jgi:hypothetical protein
MPGAQDRWDQLTEPSGRSQEGPTQLDSVRAADRPERGSLADLRQRLEQLPAGHPSSPYNDDLSRKPPTARLKDLELPLHGNERDANGSARHAEREVAATPGATESSEAARRNGSGPLGRAGNGLASADWSTPAGSSAATGSRPGSDNGISADDEFDSALWTGSDDEISPTAWHSTDDETSLPDWDSTDDEAGAASWTSTDDSWTSTDASWHSTGDQTSLPDWNRTEDETSLPDWSGGDDETGTASWTSSDDSWNSTGDSWTSTGDQASTTAWNSPDELGSTAEWSRASDWSRSARHDDPPESVWPEPGAATTVNHQAADVTPDRRGDEPRLGRDGSWEWDGRYLGPDECRLAEEALTRCRTAEGRNVFGSYGHSGLTPAMRRLEAQLGVGQMLPDTESYALKPADLFKARLADLIMRHPDKSAEELSNEVHDGIRYAYIFEAEHYAEATLQVHSRLKGQGFDLEARKNSWRNPEYKGINTRWRDPAHDIVFEVQFHTAPSWDAKQRAQASYEQIMDPATPPAERARLRAMQADRSAAIPVPPRCMAIPDYRKEGL